MLQLSFSDDGRYLGCVVTTDSLPANQWVLIFDAITWDILASHPCWLFRDAGVAGPRLFLPDPEQILIIPRPPAPAAAVSWSRGEWSARAIPTVIHWPTGEPVLTHKRGVTRAALSPDATQLVVTRGSGVFDLCGLSPEGPVNHRIKASVLAQDVLGFSPDSSTLLIGGNETVTAWGTADGQPRYVLRGHRSAVCDIAFSPNGRRIATGSADGTCRIWDAAGGRALVVIPVSAASTVRNTAWSRDGLVLSFGVSGGSNPLKFCEALPADTPLTLDFARVRACLDPAP